MTRERTYSRWDGDAVTLHRSARIYWTAGTLLLPFLVMGWIGATGLVFAAIWWFVLTPVILRDVWRRARQ